MVFDSSIISSFDIKSLKGIKEFNLVFYLTELKGNVSRIEKGCQFQDV